MTPPETTPRPGKINGWWCLALGLFGALSGNVANYFAPQFDPGTRMAIAIVGATIATAALVWVIWKFIRA